MALLGDPEPREKVPLRVADAGSCSSFFSHNTACYFQVVLLCTVSYLLATSYPSSNRRSSLGEAFLAGSHLPLLVVFPSIRWSVFTSSSLLITNPLPAPSQAACRTSKRAVVVNPSYVFDLSSWVVGLTLIWANPITGVHRPRRRRQSRPLTISRRRSRDHTRQRARTRAVSSLSLW